MQKIIPCLWYDGKAEEAVKLYVSAVKNSKIRKITRHGKESEAVSGMPEGSVLTITFCLEGQEFMALNGGPQFKFTPAVSFIINCKDQAEVDGLWEKLSDGGAKGQCGWLTDKFGMSWQIVPTALGRLMADPDPLKSSRVTQAMLKMTKINIEELERAYRGD
jgi:predicted 3-demethylubiquinone-9 3-methyltransferase (glyoxalase superfamily)